MKPNGMSEDLRVIRISTTQDAVWDAVQSAIEAGWTPIQFKREVADAWADALRREAKDAARVLLGD